MTVAFTVALVVFADQGARGLLLGNFGASALVVLGLWWVLRRRVSLRVTRRGPARDAALRAADGAGRRERVRAAGRRPLLPVPRLLPRRRRRVRDRDQARDGRVRGGARLPVRVAAAGVLDRERRARRRGCTRSSPPTTRSPPAWSCARSRCSAAGWCGCSPRHRYFDAYRALPWLALGWALYGLYLVFVAIAGRARVTSRNFPAGARRAGGQRGAAARARAAQRRRAGHRRRGHRAVRRVRGDARWSCTC